MIDVDISVLITSVFFSLLGLLQLTHLGLQFVILPDFFLQIDMIGCCLPEFMIRTTSKATVRYPLQRSAVQK